MATRFARTNHVSLCLESSDTWETGLALQTTLNRRGLACSAPIFPRRIASYAAAWRGLGRSTRDVTWQASTWARLTAAKARPRRRGRHTDVEGTREAAEAAAGRAVAGEGSGPSTCGRRTSRRRVDGAAARRVIRKVGHKRFQQVRSHELVRSRHRIGRRSNLFLGTVQLAHESTSRPSDASTPST